MNPRVYADFQNLDDDNRVRLDARGTLDDLARLGLSLSDGLALTLYTDDADEAGRPDDLLADAVVRPGEGKGWVAEVDWASVRHVSDEPGAARLNGHPAAPSASDPVA